jgi:hypothetical protein
MILVRAVLTVWSILNATSLIAKPLPISPVVAVTLMNSVAAADELMTREAEFWAACSNVPERVPSISQGRL